MKPTLRRATELVFITTPSGSRPYSSWTSISPDFNPQSLSSHDVCQYLSYLSGVPLSHIWQFDRKAGSYSKIIYKHCKLCIRTPSTLSATPYFTLCAFGIGRMKIRKDRHKERHFLCSICFHYHTTLFYGVFPFPSNLSIWWNIVQTVQNPLNSG